MGAFILCAAIASLWSSSILFELSKSLARQSRRISFLTTPRTVERLPTTPSRETHLITFIELSLLQIENLSENAEATIDLPSDYFHPYLSKTFDTLEQKLSDLTQSKQILSLDCIVYNQPSGGVTSCIKLEGMVVWISDWLLMLSVQNSSMPYRSDGPTFGPK